MEDWEKDLRADRLKRFEKYVARYGTDRCHYCNIQLVPATLTRDHKVPRSQGGILNLLNTVLACWGCNHHKGTMSYEAFLASDWLARRRIRIEPYRNGIPQPGDRAYYYTKRDLSRKQWIEIREEVMLHDR